MSRDLQATDQSYLKKPWALKTFCAASVSMCWNVCMWADFGPRHHQEAMSQGHIHQLHQVLNMFFRNSSNREQPIDVNFIMQHQKVQMQRETWLNQGQLYDITSLRVKRKRITTHCKAFRTIFSSGSSGPPNIRDPNHPFTSFTSFTMLS